MNGPIWPATFTVMVHVVPAFFLKFTMLLTCKCICKAIYIGHAHGL